MKEKKLEGSKAKEFNRDQLRQQKEDQGLQPYHRHPHYPFVLMLPLIEAGTPALVYLWYTMPQAKAEIVDRWCTLAKRFRFAWDECNKLREHLIRNKEDIPLSLLNLPQTLRRGDPGPGKVLGVDLLVVDFQDFLEKDGFDSKEAEIAIGLALNIDPNTVKEKRRRALAELKKLELAN